MQAFLARGYEKDEWLIGFIIFTRSHDHHEVRFQQHTLTKVSVSNQVAANHSLELYRCWGPGPIQRCVDFVSRSSKTIYGEDGRGPLHLGPLSLF